MTAEGGLAATLDLVLRPDDSCATTGSVSGVVADRCGVLFPTDPDTGQPMMSLPADCEGVILTE